MPTDVITRIFSGMLALFGAASLIGLAMALSLHLEDEAGKAAAREAGPPERVAIEAYELRRHTGAGLEVALRARLAASETQVAPDAYTGWIAPLYPAEPGAGPSGPAGWLIGPPAAFDRSPDRVALPGVAPVSGATNAGVTGELVEISGRRVDPNLHGGALKGFGVTVEPEMIVVQPFMEPREETYAPNAHRFASIVGLMIAAGLLTLYGGWRATRT